MIILAALATTLALVWTYVVLRVNASRAAPGEFFGNGTIAVAWTGAGILWLAWWFN